MDAKKYDASVLPGFVAHAQEYIEEFGAINNREDAISFMEVAPSHEEVEEEHNKLKEFINFRQSKADKLKEFIESCKHKDSKESKIKKDEAVLELKKLCNGSTVGLIYLRECESILSDFLALYTESEKIICSRIEPVKGFKTAKKADEGKILLNLIKAPAAGCGAPPPEVATAEQEAIEKSMDEHAEKKDLVIREMIEVDEHLTEFEERPEVAIHDMVRKEEIMMINIRKAEINDLIKSKTHEIVDLYAELMRLSMV